MKKTMSELASGNTKPGAENRNKIVNRIFGVLGIGLIPLCILLITPACNDDEQACTEQFVMLTVNIKYPDSSAVLLDSYQVEDLRTGQWFNPTSGDTWVDSLNRLEGKYFLLTDTQYDLTSRNGGNFRFVGKIDTVEVVNRTFTLGNDGCHVEIKSGNPDIVIPE